MEEDKRKHFERVYYLVDEETKLNRALAYIEAKKMSDSFGVNFVKSEEDNNGFFIDDKILPSLANDIYEMTIKKISNRIAEIRKELEVREN